MNRNLLAVLTGSRVQKGLETDKATSVSPAMPPPPFEGISTSKFLGNRHFTSMFLTAPPKSILLSRFSVCWGYHYFFLIPNLIPIALRAQKL